MTGEPWVVRKIRDFAARAKAINIDGVQLPPLSVTKGRGVVLQSDKYKKQIATDLRKYVIARRDQFAFDPMSLYYGSIGRVSSVDIGLVSPDYVVFDVDETVDKAFLNYLLRSPPQVATYETVAETGNEFGKRRRVYWSVFEDLELRLPPLAEQRRIAAILSAVDDAISATQAVIDHLWVLKNAMTAKLLRRGLPGQHTRFKQTEIGEVPAEWDVVPMGQLARAKGMVGGPFGSDLTTKDYVAVAGVPVIRGGNVSMGRFIETEFVYVSADKAQTLARNGASRGDIVMTQRGASLGEATLIPDTAKDGVYIISQTMMRMTPDSTKVDPRFLLHFTCSPVAQSWLQKHQVATGQPHLNLGIYRAMPAIVPDRAEQVTIAAAVDCVESAVTANLPVLEKQKRLKTALMALLLGGEMRVVPDEAAA